MTRNLFIGFDTVDPFRLLVVHLIHVISPVNGEEEVALRLALNLLHVIWFFFVFFFFVIFAQYTDS